MEIVRVVNGYKAAGQKMAALERRGSVSSFPRVTGFARIKYGLT